MNESAPIKPFRSPFPPVFWVANTIEVLERFAYYGIYFGFGIYMEALGFSRGELGIIQSVFLLVSYLVPVIAGTFADRFGFKKVLIVSYLAYLPSILLLQVTETFSGLALTMLSIGLAAGIFKPLVAGTVRAVTDKTNKTLGFGIFYAMVNVGASFGPLIAGKLRAISWNYAFLAAAAEKKVGILGRKVANLGFFPLTDDNELRPGPEKLLAKVMPAAQGLSLHQRLHTCHTQRQRLGHADAEERLTRDRHPQSPGMGPGLFARRR